MKRIARYRTVAIIGFDLLAVIIAWCGAYWLRFNLEATKIPADTVWPGLLVLLLVQLYSTRALGLYQSMWSFASIPDLVLVLKSGFIGAAAVLIMYLLPWDSFLIPRSILLLYPLVLLAIMAGGRLGWRAYRDGLLRQLRELDGKPVVIIGAGAAGHMLIRELNRSQKWHVVAVVDDNKNKQGLSLLGCKVAGTVADLPRVLQENNAKHAVLALPSIDKTRIQAITKIATKAGANLLTVPDLTDLMSGRVAINAMRPVKIEDLLGRDAVQIDIDHVNATLGGKHLLVTGAGGSIGSELCRQLVRFKPRQILLVENNEFALYTIEQWFRQHAPDITIIPLAADVKDAVRIKEIFEQYRPHVVFHAAAYKHVPLMEVRNAWQAVRNNVLGTYVVALQARESACERFVLISTDKAVNPTNVMGATKRLAEMMCELLHAQGQGKTRFQMVRFGNVLGSNGSVIPHFQAQIAKGGPVTVTHPEIIRYFMSIPEAAQLVLQASTLGDGGEVFVLDMGEPVKIVDMARNMIRLAGFTEKEIPIVFTGLRPGEKLYEELLSDQEATRPTPHPKLRIARSRPVDAQLQATIEQWLRQTDSQNDDIVRAQLKTWIPEYTPSVNTGAETHSPKNSNTSFAQPIRA